MHFSVQLNDDTMRLTIIVNNKLYMLHDLFDD